MFIALCVLSGGSSHNIWKGGNRKGKHEKVPTLPSTPNHSKFVLSFFYKSYPFDHDSAFAFLADTCFFPLLFPSRAYYPHLRIVLFITLFSSFLFFRDITMERVFFTITTLRGSASFSFEKETNGREPLVTFFSFYYVTLYIHVWNARLVQTMRERGRDYYSIYIYTHYFQCLVSLSSTCFALMCLARLCVFIVCALVQCSLCVCEYPIQHPISNIHLFH